MRIFAVSDLHGKTKNISGLSGIIADEKPDLLVIAGDIFNYRMPKIAIQHLQKINLPILGVRGNSDLFWNRQKLAVQTPVTLLSARPYPIEDYFFLGLNGTLPLPFASRIAFFESGMLASVQQNITKNTILVAHPPPRGVLDRVASRFHAGSFKIRSLINAYQPMMVLCGHIHEQAGFEYVKNTLVVNCSLNKNRFGAIIDCVKDAPIKIKMIKRK